MDRERFDSIARALATKGSRRRALGALIGAALLGQSAPGLAKPGKKRGKDKRRKKTVRVQQAPPGCFSGAPCNPGPGANLANCDFENSTALENANVTGANLGSANLRGADASGARLRRANLNKACLVDADLSGATIDGTTSLKDAVFCRTTLPNGTINNSGCNRGTRCCPTCIDLGEPCGPGIVGSCCDGVQCTDGFCGGCQNDDQCPGDRICCNNVCCADAQVCRAGVCAEPTCNERCSATCDACINLVNGETVCAGSFAADICGGCNSNAGCNPGEVCANSGQDRQSPLGFAFFCAGFAGACITISTCP